MLITEGGTYFIKKKFKVLLKKYGAYHKVVLEFLN